MIYATDIFTGELFKGSIYLAASPQRVRCIDIAERMNVTLPSVSRAVKELEKMGHLTRDEDGSVTLTHLEKELLRKFMSAIAFSRNG